MPPTLFASPNSTFSLPLPPYAGKATKLWSCIDSGLQLWKPSGPWAQYKSDCSPGLLFFLLLNSGSGLLYAEDSYEMPPFITGRISS